jgi:putative transposase
MVGPGVERAAIAHLRAVLGLSERRACRVIGADRTSMRYRTRRPDDGLLRVRLRALAN